MFRVTGSEIKIHMGVSIFRENVPMDKNLHRMYDKVGSVFLTIVLLYGTLTFPLKFFRQNNYTEKAKILYFLNLVYLLSLVGQLMTDFNLQCILITFIIAEW
jgi:hypothetical protein